MKVIHSDTADDAPEIDCWVDANESMVLLAVPGRGVIRLAAASPDDAPKLEAMMSDLQQRFGVDRRKRA